LVVVRLIVLHGSPRWLPRAEADLQGALEQLRSVELLRAAEVDGIVQAAGHPEHSSLALLMKVAPDPWPNVFGEHREALRTLVADIDTACTETKRVLQAAARRRLLPSARAPRPTREEAAATSAAYRSALATLATVPQLSLADFLD
jgi:hypothetical protein